MKKLGLKSFSILSSNKHLLNILDCDYYIELGNVTIKALDRLLNGDKVYLKDLLFKEIVNTGIGQISNDEDNDDILQINYLFKLHQKESSTKFVLTCSTLKYYDENGNEIYAPIILLPININYQTQEVYMNGNPTFNKTLSHYFVRKNCLKSPDEFLKLSNKVVSSVFEIDTLSKEYAASINSDCKCDTTNYLTLVSIEYPDFIPKQNYFKSQRSIYETTDTKILDYFFKNVKSILPTNIEQKYILNKVHNGESFIVDGKLGSGKTHTIINIIGDAIADNKKVLYVNQSLDMINQLQQTLMRLGIDEYSYALTPNLGLQEKIDVLNISKHDSFDSKAVDEALAIRDQYEKTFHRYTYSYIIENLAIEKSRNTRKDIPLEKILERHDVENIYRILQNIEKELETVDPFSHNLYSTLISKGSVKTAAEIKGHVKKFYDTQVHMVTYLNNLCETYRLNEIINIQDFNHFINELLSFKQIKPLPIWTSNDFYDNAQKALQDITDDIEMYYYVDNYYKEHCASDYKIGSIGIKFSEIISGHYDIKTSGNYDIEKESSEDAKYVNELLSNGSDLVVLVNDIEKWSKSSLETYEQLKKIFDFDVPTDEQFKFFVKLQKFYEQHSVDDAWYDEYLSSPKELIAKEAHLRSDVNLLFNYKKQISSYLFSNVAGYKEIDGIIQNRRFSHLLKKRVNKTTLKHDHKSFTTLVRDVKEYYNQANIVRSYLPKDTHRNLLDEDTWSEYAGFVEFVATLSVFEHKAFSHLLTKLSRNKTYLVDHIVKLLSILIDDMRILKTFESAFEKYHLVIGGTNYIEIVESIQSLIPYLEMVIKNRNDMLAMFKNKSKINTKEILILIAVDERHDECIHRVERNHERYVSLFGDGYQKFDTNVTVIRQSIDYFKEFTMRLRDYKHVKSLLATKSRKAGVLELFDNLLDEINTLVNLSNEWYHSALREFSKCFYHGRMYLQEKSFKEISSILSNYMDKLYQVDNTFNIEHELDDIYDYGLTYLASHIQSGELSKGVAENFFYSTMNRYYEEMLKQGLLPIHSEALKISVENYISQESNYVENNLSSLRNKLVNNKPSLMKVKNKILSDNNIYMQTYLSAQKNYQVFLADVDAFANLTDLSGIDIVLIDDAHTATSNKFSKFLEAKQTIVFGNRSFQTSVTNSLMQRFNTDVMVTLNKRYLNMNLSFENEFYNRIINSNIFVYNYNLKVNINGIAKLQELVIDVVNNYLMNKCKINIVIYSQDLKRKIYTLLVTTLKETYSIEETIQIIDNNIHIITIFKEVNMLADYVYVLYNDLIIYEETKHQQSNIELLKKNYLLASKAVNIYYYTEKIEENNKILIEKIENFINTKSVTNKYIDGITLVLFNYLCKLGLKVSTGFGDIDIIVYAENKLLGINIFGKKTMNNYSMLDDYIYYHKIYSLFSWKILTYTIEELYNNDLDIVINDIQKELGGINDK